MLYVYVSTPSMGTYSQSTLRTDQRTNAVVDSRRIRMTESAFFDKFYRACLLILLINSCTCDINEETNGKSIDSVYFGLLLLFS
jgi:hypothetical protein